MRMDPKIKKAWTEALRSDKYSQGKDRLKDGNSFCCLGVLCDLHRKATKKGQSAWEGEKYLEHDTELPERVTKWAGLEGWHAYNPKVNYVTDEGRPCEDYISNLNDSGKYDFRKIADIIEENF